MSLGSTSVILYEDKKGHTAAKTYGCPSWSSSQSKVSKTQKIKGLLNVFGVYDYTNDPMFTHSYKRKTSRQFLDFIKRVDRNYGDNDVKQIFLLLYNASIHKSKMVKETIASYHPRIQLVFLPTISPELNLICIWLWIHRQTINNFTFEHELDIFKAVPYGTNDYNENHGIRTSITGLQMNVSYFNTPDNKYKY